MSQMKRSILGIPSGRIADLIFRYRNGKLFISAAPAEVKISNSVLAVETRDRMKLVSPFCKALTENLVIRSIWDNSEILGETARHKIFSINYPLLGFDAPLSNAKILPENFFSAVINNYQWDEDKIELTVDALSSVKKLPMYNPEIFACGVIHIFNPKEASNKANRFLSAASLAAEFTNELPITFKIIFTQDDKDQMAQYTSHEILLCLILKNKKQEPVSWSEQVHLSK